MQKSVRHAGILGLVFFLTTETLFAAGVSPAFPTQSLNTSSRTALAKISDPVGKIWARERLSSLSEALRSTKYLSGDRQDIKKYKNEIIENITQTISKIQSGKYAFQISDTLRSQTEADIISYQRPFVEAMQTYLTKVLGADTRETGNIHFTLQSKDADISVDVDTYRVTMSRDRKNAEIDARIHVVVQKSGKKAIDISVDGSIMLIGHDIYLTMRSGKVMIDDPDASSDLKELQTFLSEIQGKTYHQKLSEDTISSIFFAYEDPQTTFDHMNQVLTILKKESLLTPIATEGSDILLAFRKETLQKIAHIMGGDSSIVDEITTESLVPAFDIRTDGKSIRFTGYNDGNISGIFSHHTDGTPLITIDMQERGSHDPYHWKLQRSPLFWAFAGGSGEYTLDTQIHATSASAVVKKWTQTIATAKIDANGLDAWTYDASVLWEDTNYDSETESPIIDTIRLHLWWAIKEEFGRFQLTPPSIYEELEKTKFGSNYVKEERDSARMSNLWAIESALRDFYDANGKYPTPATDGCLDLSPLKPFLDPDFSLQSPLSTDTCTSGYVYRLISSNGGKISLLGARMELKNSANYSNTFSLSQVKNSKKLSSLMYPDMTEDASTWLYVTRGYHFTY